MAASTTGSEPEQERPMGIAADSVERWAAIPPQWTNGFIGLGGVAFARLLLTENRFQ